MPRQQGDLLMERKSGFNDTDFSTETSNSKTCQLMNEAINDGPAFPHTSSQQAGSYFINREMTLSGETGWSPHENLPALTAPKKQKLSPLDQLALKTSAVLKHAQEGDAAAASLRNSLFVMNRQLLLEVHKRRQLSRLELEAKSRVKTKSILFGEYGVCAPPPAVRNFDFDSSFVEAAQMNSSTLDLYKDFRNNRLKSLQAKKFDRMALEETTGIQRRRLFDLSNEKRFINTAPERSSMRALQEEEFVSKNIQKEVLDLDRVFKEHSDDCRSQRYSGTRKKENYSESLKHVTLTQQVFTQPLYWKTIATTTTAAV